MKRTTQWGAFCLAGGFALATAALAQDSQQQTTTQQTTTQQTQVSDDGVARTTTTTVTGKVVRYEPGKTIVVATPHPCSSGSPRNVIPFDRSSATVPHTSWDRLATGE